MKANDTELDLILPEFMVKHGIGKNGLFLHIHFDWREDKPSFWPTMRTILNGENPRSRLLKLRGFGKRTLAQMESVLGRKITDD